MRDILFRGKRLDNGKWVEGFLARTTLGSTIIVNEVEEYSCGCCIGIGSANFEVDPSTVGQYTGLKDKNGKRIFEGDIARTHYANTRKNDFVEQMVFHNGRFCSLYKIPGPGNGKIWSNLADGVPHLPQDKTPYMEWCEIIGNVHDNPELLKVGEGE